MQTEQSQCIQMETPDILWDLIVAESDIKNLCMVYFLKVRKGASRINNFSVWLNYKQKANETKLNKYTVKGPLLIAATVYQIIEPVYEDVF